MDNFSIVRTKKGKEVLIYNENLSRVFNMKKNTVVGQADYLGILLTEDQEPRWIEMSNDCDTKYAFKGETKVEMKNLLSILYGRVENDQPTLEKYQRAVRRREQHGGKRRSRKAPARKTHARNEHPYKEERLMFTVIENEQTPALSEMDDAEEFVSSNGELLKNFLKYAKSHGRAAGLASNQVGLKDRFIAVKTESGWILAIDPEIKAAIGERKNCIEGCLSWPGKDIIASRYEQVLVSYYDLSGEQKTRLVKDSFESQVWQHEINHLNGVEELVTSKKEPVRNEVKIGRNDPCICGSGKKYKKCCL